MLAVSVLLMLVFSSLGVAVDSNGVDSNGDDSCNWWCKVKSVFGGNVVGK